MLIGLLMAGQHTSSTSSAWLGFFLAQDKALQVRGRGGGGGEEGRGRRREGGGGEREGEGGGGGEREGEGGRRRGRKNTLRRKVVLD